MAPPAVLLLDLDREKEPLEAAKRAISLCGADCRIIFVGAQNDITLYRRFKQLGAADYLVKPLAEDVLREAVLQALVAKHDDVLTKPSEVHDGKLIPVIGARGGIGASTVAINLAWICAHVLNQQVGVLDLDVHFGTSALSVDREPGRGMRAALENPERLDGLLVASSMVQESDKLSILCAEENIDTPLHFDGDASLSLLKPVTGSFDTVFVDLPRHMLAAQKRLLVTAHAVVLVCDLSLAGLRDARRIRAYLKSIRPDLLPILVANRTGDSGFSALDKTTFEKNLEAKVDFEIAEDAKTAKQAANLGKACAAVAPQAEISKILTQLARMLVGLPEEKKAKEGSGLLKSLLGHGLSLHKPTPKPA
jgi:pilus assembly protein CpaE